MGNRTSIKYFILLLFILLPAISFGQSYKWANSMGNTFSDEGKSIAIDDSGYVYLTGTFAREVYFDPDSMISPLTSVGNSKDIFIAKYDSTGKYVWAISMGGNTSDEGKSIAVDNSGNIYSLVALERLPGGHQKDFAALQ